MLRRSAKSVETHRAGTRRVETRHGASLLRAGLVALLLAMLALATARVSVADPGKPRDKIDPAVWLLLEHGPAPVIIYVQAPPLPHREGIHVLKASADAAQAGLRRELAAAEARGAVSGVEELWIINAVAATVDADTLLALAARPDVTAIRADRSFHMETADAVIASVAKQSPAFTEGSFKADSESVTDREAASSVGSFAPHTPERRPPRGEVMALCYEQRSDETLPDPRGCSASFSTTRTAITGTVTAWGVERIGADRVWQDFGLRGEGVTVAVVDTGAQWTHPALIGSYLGAGGNHAYAWFDATGESPRVPVDPLSHGTHVLGTIVGEDATHHVGVAPGARWMAVRIFDHNGVSSEARVHRAFQWLLAPTDLDGQNPDPSRAPKVANFSWGNINGASDVYAPDIARLREAGILTVWSAGNNGRMGAGTVGTPAALDDAFAVGAVAADDTLDLASAQGPSFFGHLKPDVTAPGVRVLSTVPTDTFALGTGTSMAAPHVAGLAALIWQANPRLAVGDVQRLLRLTAVDLGDAGPDNRFGAGRIDAYKAVAWARSAGQLVGEVSGVTPGEAALVTVWGVRRSDGTAFTSQVSADGSYTVTVPAGVYDVAAEALGYTSAISVAATVETGGVAQANPALVPAPRYPVTGYVARQVTGEALDATITALNTPFSTETAWDGTYKLDLPAGTYTLEVRAPHTRIERLSVTVDADHPTARANALLSDAPSILLVDADAWDGDMVAPYYRRALADAGFIHDTWVVSDTRASDPPAPRPVVRLPDLDVLRRYDIVVWVHSTYSPGVLNTSVDGTHDAVGTLRGYLAGGGRVLLIGQDIGFFDVQGGWNRMPLAPDFYRDTLHASFVAGDANAETAVGTPGGLFDGLTVHLSAPGGYRRDPEFTLQPDVIAALGGARVVMGYTEADGAALAVSNDPSRLLYLAFDLDGAAREEQAETMRRALGWLSEPPVYRVYLPLVRR
ncbi:MAG: S8 family serine peptidase [Anaerolineae bacterium]